MRTYNMISQCYFTEVTDADIKQGLYFLRALILNHQKAVLVKCFVRVF
jgi:hypothetical protein